MISCTSRISESELFLDNRVDVKLRSLPGENTSGLRRDSSIRLEKSMRVAFKCSEMSMCSK